MTDRPIIFSASMVKALLDGRKTMTRRIMKEPIGLWENDQRGNLVPIPRPYKPGDRLYVRESYAPRYFDGGKHGFKADWTGESADCVPEPKWKPSIHMPREASRITLTVTSVKVERLQDISEEDARAEGVERDDGGHGLMAGYSFKLYDKPGYICFAATESFKSLWQFLNAKRAPWDSNPFVIAISFKVIKANIDAMKEAA